MLGVYRDLIPTTTHVITQSDLVQTARGQFFSISSMCQFQCPLSMAQGLLRLPGMDSHLGQVPLCLGQDHKVTTRLDNPPCLLQQRLRSRQVEGLLGGQDRETVEDGALHHAFACLPCVCEQ